MEKQLVYIGGELDLRKQIQDQHNGLPLKVQELVDPHETPTANHRLGEKRVLFLNCGQNLSIFEAF